MSRTPSSTGPTLSCYRRKPRPENTPSRRSRRWPRIAEYTESHLGTNPIRRRHEDYPLLDGTPIARAVALAARQAAEDLNARYIVAFTESGSTVRLVSHSRPKSHILGFTPYERVYRRLAMRWGVTPMHGDNYQTTETMLEIAMKFLKQKGFVNDGDVVVIVCGHTTLPGATNMIKVLTL